MREFILPADRRVAGSVLSFLINLFDQVDTGFLLLDNEQIIRSVNFAFVRICGWKREEIEGKKALEFLESVDGSRLFKVKRRDGEILLLPGVSFLLKVLSEDSIGEMILLNTKEAYLKRIRELENILLYTRGAVHDINNLLTIIGMNLEVLEFYSIDPKMQPIFEKAKRAVSKTRELLQRVSMLYQKRVEESFLIEEVLKEAIDIVLSGSEIDLRFELERDLPQIVGDRVQISQVIQNLLINAKEAMKEDRRLLIRASLVDKEVEGSEFKKWIKIEVEDWGVGIDRRHLPKLFEPDFSTKREGRGLGLSVSKRIVERHGGFIEVLPKEKGTIFVVYLPVRS